MSQHDDEARRARDAKQFGRKPAEKGAGSQRDLHAPKRGEDGREVPVWSAIEGSLYWRGAVVVTNLATWAHAERLLLNTFEQEGWPPFIADPFPRDTVGHDPTQSRRSAIYNLKCRLGSDPPIVIFSTNDGQIGWRRVRRQI